MSDPKRYEFTVTLAVHDEDALRREARRIATEQGLGDEVESATATVPDCLRFVLDSASDPAEIGIEIEDSGAALVD